MNRRSILCMLAWTASLIPVSLAAAHGGHTIDSHHFAYDSAPVVVKSNITASPEFYDAGLGHVGSDNVPFMAFLQYVPGTGDYLWLAPVTGGRVRDPMRLLPDPGAYAAPTFAGNWLSYEILEGDTWQIHAVGLDHDGNVTGKVVVRSAGGHAINHAAAADAAGNVWYAWQEDNNGYYDVYTRRLSKAGDLSEVYHVGNTPWGDWQPAVTVTPGGNVCVAWDAAIHGNFDVLCRWYADGKWEPTRVVAGTPAFEGRPSLASDRRGWTWIAWEEGAENWGRPFRGKEGPWNNLTDTYGPVHRFRKTHVARLHADGSLERLAQPMPMPGFAAAAAQENRRSGAAKLGVFYEQPNLVVDGYNRVWVTYRHFYQTQAALEGDSEHHVEYGWALYSRCIDGDRWSAPWSYDIHQRDGMQRIATTPHGDGLVTAWTTGRTDRRIDPEPRGTAIGVLEHAGGAASTPAFDTSVQLTELEPIAVAETVPPLVADERYAIFYGDLHRHTDLSLCWPFFDGSIEDAYRYAIDVGGLDFLGITDHTRDLDHGDALSQLWWRCTKEVRRHELRNNFAPMFAFERSHGETDHNIISLRDDMIQDFPTPLRYFWEDMGNDTFSIPHAPINTVTWKYQDDAHRPLAEIYQGCRDYDSQEKIHAGLDLGYRLGFIASSDHLSTSASYACVWAPGPSREEIFRAMQARRTFGATAHIRLKFMAGKYWMGETLTTGTVPTFSLQIEGTAPIEALEVIHNGEVIESLEVKGERDMDIEFVPDAVLEEKNYFYVHMRQVDGNRAWSSPIWVSRT